MIDGVEQPKGLSSMEFVIPVNHIEYLPIIAILSQSILRVLQSITMFFVTNEDNFIFWKIAPLEMPSNKLRCFVFREVVNNDQLVIAILLLNN